MAFCKRFKKKTRKRTNNKIKRNIDYSNVCQLAKRAFKHAQRQFHENLTHVDRRHRFIVQRSNYKKAIYINKRNYIALELKRFLKKIKSIS